MFDMEHARWLDENCKLMSELRGALQAHLPEASFTVIVDQCIMNYDELFQLKAEVAKSDVFHLLSGSWTTPAERSFLWMGGFRPSELLQVKTLSFSFFTTQAAVCSTTNPRLIVDELGRY